MHYKLLTRCIGLALLTAGLTACSDDEVKPEPGGGTYLLRFPSYFPQPIPLLSNNAPLTYNGVALGEKLFFDPILSGNNKLSCGSCHKPAMGFADGLALTDVGASGKKLHRHSPALVNLAWADGFFWDGGSKNLESQALGPITNTDEMAQNIVELVNELNGHAEYPALFKKTFIDGEISPSNIVKALAQFERTLISATTKYDEYRSGKTALNETELAGMKLVEMKCGGCHAAPLFTDNKYHNNGLDSEFSDMDEGIAQGRYRITFLPEDLGKFKVPTLRNIAASAPYMHDGRFQTLDDVLDHYASGINNSSTLDVLIPATGMQLTDDERVKIMAFLETLTDNQFMEEHKQHN